MVAVASAVGGANVRERHLKTVTLGVDAVADRRTIFHGIRKDADDCPRRNVHYVVHRSTPLRKSSQIAGQEAESLLAAHRSRGNTGIQSKQVSDGTGIARRASRTDRRHVLHQREQISTWRRRNGNVQD